MLLFKHLWRKWTLSAFCFVQDRAQLRWWLWRRLDSHVGPGGNAALVDAVWQVDQLTVVVLEAVRTEGLVHTLTGAQWHGQTPVEGQQAQQKDTQ